MGLYSKKDAVLDEYISRAYEALLTAGYGVDSETFSEIPYGVGFKAVPDGTSKAVSVTVYRSEKKGFSIVTKDAGIRSVLMSLLTPKGRAGSDEAGKGDFFGPLVVAAFYVEPGDRQLFSHSISDSKKLSAKRAEEFLSFVSGNRRNDYSVVRIMPRRYNSLYEDMKKQGKNSDHMLGWAHKKALKGLAEKKQGKITSVVVDKFTSSASIIGSIRHSVPGAEWLFEHRAEQHPAVAGASLIARAEYLRSLRHLSRTVLDGTVSLHSGSGTDAEKTARTIAETFPEEVFRDVCKVNFRTLKKVLKI